MPLPTTECFEPYSSDLSDLEWSFLSPLLPIASRLGRPARYDRRLVLNAIFYVVRSGCAWRLLPHDLPPWRLCYHYFAIWRESGLWEQINDALREQVRLLRGKKSPQRWIASLRSPSGLPLAGCLAWLGFRRTEC